MYFLTLATLLFSYQAVAADAPKPFGLFNHSIIHAPVGKEQMTYPRYAELADGTLLATTWLEQGTGGKHFPVFESKDGGAHSTHVSDLVDKVNGVGIAAHPFLSQLTEDLGDYKAGTIIATFNSVYHNSTGAATILDLYISTDRARSWNFVSQIATGGPKNTNAPVWEAFLLPYKGQLVAYYTDGRDAKHSQKLSHQTTTDLKNWGPVVDDVVYQNSTFRPGMSVIEYIPPLDQWILVYELLTGVDSYGANFPVWYVMAKSPLEFRNSVPRPIIVNKKTAPNACPYVAWSPVGGPNGTIVVTSTNKPVYTNSHGGAIDKWEEHDTPARSTYSRSIQIFKKFPDHLGIYEGDSADEWAKGPHVPYSFTVVSLRETLLK
ncbi:related to BNR/Asp-box repeat domain protein [Rhynchosporium agropyri]|uniref:Related to BNR/Asp-box repeat domain protein n=1 Tax=Rhynchosporium agropyri TaxID=914238 RepID=A0A1E1JRC0_9HELO|nr:related to BNR/Asp-box repeat domain protein [Rhynchosporium agropyri]